jgi:hypothetical protein
VVGSGRLHAWGVAGALCNTKGFIDEHKEYNRFQASIPHTQGCARQVVRFEGGVPPREQLFWNLALQHLLASAPDDAAVSAMFERLAANAVRRCA